MDTSVRCFNHSELTSKTTEQKTKDQSQKEKIKFDEIKITDKNIFFI